MQPASLEAAEEYLSRKDPLNIELLIMNWEHLHEHTQNLLIEGIGKERMTYIWNKQEGTRYGI